MWTIFWPSGASPSATKPYDGGAEVWYRIGPDAEATAASLGDTWHLDELFVTIQGEV
jgi:hypothetical protein